MAKKKIKKPEYGDTVMVRSTPKREFEERYFVMSLKHATICLKRHINYEDFEIADAEKKGDMVHFWQYMEGDSIPYTLGSFNLYASGLLRVITWDKGAFTTRYDVNKLGIYLMYGSKSVIKLTWKEASVELEWLNVDGSVSPFADERK